MGKPLQSSVLLFCAHFLLEASPEEYMPDVYRKCFINFIFERCLLEAYIMYCIVDGRRQSLA